MDYFLQTAFKVGPRRYNMTQGSETLFLFFVPPCDDVPAYWCIENLEGYRFDSLPAVQKFCTDLLISGVESEVSQANNYGQIGRAISILRALLPLTGSVYLQDVIQHLIDLVLHNKLEPYAFGRALLSGDYWVFTLVEEITQMRTMDNRRGNWEAIDAWYPDISNAKKL